MLIFPALLVACSSAPSSPATARIGAGEAPVASMGPESATGLSAEAVDPDTGLSAGQIDAADAGAAPADTTRDGGFDILQGPSRILDIAHAPGTLWVGSPEGLMRFDLATRRLDPVHLHPATAAVSPLAADPARLYLELGTAAGGRSLARYDLRAGALTPLEAPDPAGPVSPEGDSLWVAGRGDRAGLSRISGLEAFSLSYPRPDEMPAGEPVAVAARPDQVLVATREGAMLRLEPRIGRWTMALHPREGAGEILGVVPWRDGFAISSRARGLWFVAVSGERSPLAPAARMRHLATDGGDLWGLEGGKLVRFDSARGQLVAVPTTRRLEQVSRLVVSRDGFFVACADGLYLIEPSGRIALAIRNAPARPATVATEAEIEGLLRLLSGMTPPQKRAAYEKLRQAAGEGYDEVFLVGLNEDDSQTLEVVSEYFRIHHPPQAIEPLIDVLLTLQGDRAMRDHLAGVLETFGPAAIAPVAGRLTTEMPEMLEGGARQALEQVLVAAIDRGGPETLNHFLAGSHPDWLLAYGTAEVPRSGSPFVNGETFRILARRLSGAADERVIEGGLRAVSRLARQPSLPPSVSQLVPVLLSHLEGPHRRWALYALALIGDGRATAPCERIARNDPDHRFWALQALAATGDPKAFPALIQALGDDRTEVRDAAAFLLRAELVREGAPALRRVLVEESGPLCTSCVDALGLLRDEAARPVLEARLPGARRDEQADLLEALLTVSDAGLAARIRGWLEVELLAPARVGRVSIEPGADLRVLAAALAIVAADGGAEGVAFLRQAKRELTGEAGRYAGEALMLAEALPAGLSPLIERAVLGPPAGSRWAGVPFALPALDGTARRSTLGRIDADTFSSLRSLIFGLVPRRADGETRAVLERILLTAARPADREQAARALFTLASPASIPALVRALEDPFFQEGPFPLYRYPVRHVAARALNRLGRRVVKQADRSFKVM